MGALVLERQGRATDTDAQLARAAIAGDGEAFARLYDRHERRAFNLCYRITGSRDDAADATQDAFVKVLTRLPAMADRELDFGNYLLTAARHASYDVMSRAGRAEPRDEIPDSAAPVGGAGAPPPEDDPERRALLEAQQEEIRAANAELPVRQREALALFELGEMSYDEIAEELGMNRNSVAQLISRARVNLRDGLRRTALASILPGSPACERALPLIAMRDDRQLDGTSDDAKWMRAHLAECETCRLGEEAMAEAGASYRAWALVPALEVLRRETIAKAAEGMGHDWSAAARPPRSPAATGGAAGGAAAGGALAGAAAAGATGTGGAFMRRLGRDFLIAGVAGATFLGGVLAVRTARDPLPSAPAAHLDAGLVGVDPGLVESTTPIAGAHRRHAAKKTATGRVLGASATGLLGGPLADAAGSDAGTTAGAPAPHRGGRTRHGTAGGAIRTGSTSGTPNTSSGPPASTPTTQGTSDPTPGSAAPTSTPNPPASSDPPARTPTPPATTGDGSSGSSGTGLQTGGGSDGTGVQTGASSQSNTNTTTTTSNNGSTSTGSSTGGGGDRTPPTRGGDSCAQGTRGCIG